MMKSTPTFRRIPGILTAALAVALLAGCEDGGGNLGDGHDFGGNDPNLHVAMGDSITQGYGASSAYPAILAAMLGEPVVNEGAGGAHSSDGSARVTGVLNRYRPGFLLIQYGINDVTRGTDLNQIIANLQAIIAAAQANQTIPVIATLTPVFYSHAAYQGEVQRLNDRIRSLASSQGVAVADLESAFGRTPLYLQSDGLHPTDAGQQVIAQQFFGVLR